MDRFLEEVVKKHKRGVDEAMYYISWAMMIAFGVMTVLCLQLLMLGQLDVMTILYTLVFAGMTAYLWFTHDKLRPEYEYTFTNGSMDFAVVYNNKKRKNLGSLNVAKVDAFGPAGPDSGSFHRHSSAPNVKHLRWFLNREAQLYYFAFSKDGNKSIIVFEPSEQMVAYIKHYLPYGAYQEN